MLRHFHKRSWLFLHNFRAKYPMKLNAPDDLLSKCRSTFDPVSIMQLPKIFFFIFVASFLLVGNDENTKFSFCQKGFHLMEIRCNQS